MRGDSLRDLYAKALALLGLGLLGAAGALVDYWPVPSALPAVASALVVPVDSGLPVLRLTAATHESSPAAAFRSSRTKSPAARATDEGLAIPVTNSNDDVFGLRESQTESLVRFAAIPPSLDVAPASMADMPVSTLDLNPPAITAFEEAPENPLVPQPVPPTQNRENRFAGAAKTGAKAVAWTGSAIAKPFVALGHVLHL